MSVGSVGASSLASQLYAKLFAQTDTDKSGGVSFDELDAARQIVPQAGSNGPATSEIFSRLDKDGDGNLVAGEMSAASLFDSQTLQSLVGLQAQDEAAKAAREAEDQKAIDDLFARADLNGDGQLDKGELDAEKALRRAQYLDGGSQLSGPVFFMKAAFGDGETVSRDDVHVAHLIKLPYDLQPIKKPVDWQNLAPRRPGAPDPPPPRTVETVLERAQADLANSLSPALIARLLARLGAAGAEAPETSVTA